MQNDRIVLTSKDIYGKDFKIDARGYCLQEVDKYLDIIIGDYNEFNNIISILEKEIKRLTGENQELKQEVRNLRTSLDAIKHSEKEVTNVDLIRRVSQLEKIILGKTDN